MQSSVKDTLKSVVVCFAVMLALPLAYRIWIHYNPQPESTWTPLSQRLEKATEENALRLLKTPLAKWTTYDQKQEPQIHAWLTAHEQTVLPWEWTDEARRKDPDGYRKLWIKLFKEQESELKTRMKTEQKKLKALEREIQIAETIHTHRTNQLARIQAYVATNTFPMTIQVVRLEKGRL